MASVVPDVIIIIVSIIAIILFAFYVFGEQLQYVIFHIFSQTAWDVASDVSLATFLLKSSNLQDVQTTLSYKATYRLKASNSQLEVIRSECPKNFVDKENICKVVFPYLSGTNFNLQGKEFVIKKQGDKISIVVLS